MKYFPKIGLATALFFNASAANALEYDDLKKVCTGAQADVTDVRSKYVSQVLEKNSIQVDFLTSQGIFETFVTYCNDPKNRKKCKNMSVVNDNVRDLLVSGALQVGDIRLRLSENVSPAKSPEIYKFLATAPQPYELYCSIGIPATVASPKKPEGLKFNSAKFSISKDNSTVLKDAIAKKEFAELGVKLDRGAKTKIANPDGTETLKNNDVYSANFSIAIKDFLQFHRKKSDIPQAPGPSFSPFVSLAYESAFDPNKEKDELSAGIIWTQYFSDRNFPRTGPYQRFQFELDRVLLEGSYITDIEERQSQQWAAQATLPFLTYDGSESKEGGFSVPFIFAADLVVDYWDVARAGDKEALAKLVDEQKTKTITRLGYDLRLNADLVQSNAWSLSFDTKYQFRDATRTGRLGDANRLEVGLGFSPQLKSGEDSNLSFGLTYERGESLKSLLEEELWKLSIKYKQ